MCKWVKFVSILVFSMILAVGCSNNENTDQVSKKEAKTASDSKKNVELTISAAASLKDAMDVIQHTYEEKNPEVKLKFNFGGSGSLQQQITQGAPVDLFFSAAEDKFDLLVEEELIAKEDGLDLLGNELVLVVPRDAQSIKGFEDLTKAEVSKISIGTPETVPAGKYAKESLENSGVWKEVESKIVFAKDVRQVLSYVETGNVEAGIVYKTDALVSDKVEVVASADTATHPPIIYPVGVIKDSKQYEAAKVFYDYLQSADALKVFEEYGFTIK
ncbi:molybdate transport system substrate-binding protein [Cytobacillus eiseniae]|uniref:Molybdate transport system substrate-binding protein n=1 Tax=Cytobacillus eiseniae TaxID=762947 RepID=A0ABS4RA57_9BACI|nr:molybdate ABC transporter substrate-binding protein [Cytobacillus eiseniae]MBP2239766.1 molybdate transport system substrate-binding protein [Cytobacillus eiseniae]